MVFCFIQKHECKGLLILQFYLNFENISLWKLCSSLLSCALSSEFQRLKRKHFFKSVISHQSQAEWVLTTFPKIGQNIWMNFFFFKKSMYQNTLIAVFFKKLLVFSWGVWLVVNANIHAHMHKHGCTQAHTFWTQPPCSLVAPVKRGSGLRVLLVSALDTKLAFHSQHGVSDNF